MKWLQPKRLLQRPAGRERGGEDRRRPTRIGPAASLCIASGKGGAGKSVVTASLAHLFADLGRTLLVDADLGVGNAHILQDVSPEASFVDLVEGRAPVRDLLQPCRGNLDLLAGGCGVSRMADLNACERQLVACGLEELEAEYRYLLVDSAAGISRQTLSFAVAADLVLVVTTPDLTAMTDAYAFVKVLLAKRPTAEPRVLVNRARNAAEGQRVFERIARVAQRFLEFEPRYLGWLPDDPAVTASVNRRAPVVVADPDCAWSAELRPLFGRLCEDLDAAPRRGLGRAMGARGTSSARTA